MRSSHQRTGIVQRGKRFPDNRIRPLKDCGHAFPRHPETVHADKTLAEKLIGRSSLAAASPRISDNRKNHKKQEQHERDSIQHHQDPEQRGTILELDTIFPSG